MSVATAYIKLRSENDSIRLSPDQVDEARDAFEDAVERGEATFTVYDYQETRYIVPVSEVRFFFEPALKER